jgi:alkanesulfonate monooxygenase SsuD/methylene tetrahydromethanopterin reductase-like flavin-dependent oxidoreductase (luciferase family)
MAELGVMIEAQEGLTWPLWRAVVRDAERLGFAALRTSDHMGSSLGVEGRPSLACWSALALAAEWTERIQLGTMVSPITFYVPAVLGRTARAVDELSGGRLVLGVGAGWNDAEHERFGIPFPGWRERFDRLEEGIARIRQAFAGPLLIGGGGERRTRTLAAREAAEWNLAFVDADTFREKSAALDRRCEELGRDPRAIRRSIMCPYLAGRDEDELLDRVRRLAGVMPWLAGTEPAEALSGLRSRFFVGSPEEIAGQMRPYVEAGTDLFMLQHLVLDDPGALELVAEVRPLIA